MINFQQFFIQHFFSGATMAQEQKPGGVGTNNRKFGYADTVIENPTDFTAYVHVRYLSSACEDADPVIAPGGNWTETRYLCLICEITAQMEKGSQIIKAASYGPLAVCTAYARFIIVKNGNDSFEVIHAGF